MKEKIISLLMLFVLLLSAVPAIHAYNEHAPEKPREVVELREKNSQTFRLDDGSYECVVYADDKYYEDDSGALAEIDNSIVNEEYVYADEEYVFANKANSSRAYFAAAEPAVLVSSKAQSLAFGLQIKSAVAASVGGLKDTGEIAGYPLSGDNVIAYPRALQSTDIVYEVRNGAVKEYIILNDASAPTEFTFTFDTRHYTAAYTECGNVAFYDASGELCFELADLFAVDSAETYTEELTYTIGETVNGKTDIIVSLSEEYAYDHEREYPVLIDPSIMITNEYNTRDSYVCSRYPTTNYYMSNYLKTGRDADHYVRRTYIRFDLPLNLYGANIISAYINIKKYTGSEPSINAYRVTGNWTSSTITWNNKPGATSENASGTAVAGTGSWYELYVTNIVKSWTNGAYTNYGFMIKDATETGTSQWTAYYSSDAPSPNKPELRITYSIASFTMRSYLDNGFTKRFTNGVQMVNAYQAAVESRLEAIFPVNVVYSTQTFISYCDECKNMTYGNSNWGSEALAYSCPHTQLHLKVRADPPYNYDITKGFYFHFVLTNGVGTGKISKYFWTGHIPNPSGQNSFSVQYFTNADNSQTLHNIACIMPKYVVNSDDYSNKQQDVVDKEYTFTLLHETSHQLGAPDHYCTGISEGAQSCSNPYCWECHPSLAASSCVMYMRYDISNLDKNTTYCPQCRARIRSHLQNHHF